MSEWTILDPYGTPYGGHRDNANSFIRRGGAGYEAPEYDDPNGWTYGLEVSDAAWYGRNNVSGRA
ncbi:hypothetical protein ACFVH6_25860 [Spirillospora sp. NPDC127200]